MKPLTGKLFALLALLVVTQAALGKLTATVDRNELTELDLLTYTLRLEDATTTDSPNFSALERDFDIVQQSGPNRSSRITIRNGQQQAESYTEWVLTLRPRRTGNLQIPAFRLGSEVSQPVSVTITEASQSARRRMDQFVFFDTSVDKTKSYVQEQVIYTVKLFYVDSISGDFPPPPQLDNAVIETIENEKRYESIVNNRRFFVLEKQYAIYPQRSGILEIPGETFNGTRGRGSFFSARERVTAVSEGHRLQIHPRPLQFTGNHWLPAEEVELSETWSASFSEFKVGEPVNRTLTLHATGLASSLLPPFEPLDIDGAKTYQDPAETNDTTTNQGIVSSLETTVGIVPTSEGTLEIPEIRIPWWNTETDKQEVAVIPARTVTVAAGTTPSVNVPSEPETSATSPDAGPAVRSPLFTNLWLYVALALAAAWLLTLWQLFTTRQKLYRVTSTLEPAEAEDHSVSERQAFNDLRSACNANDPDRARRLLFVWGKARYPHIRSLKDLCRAAEHPSIAQEVAALETALFARDAAQMWEGASLLSIVNELRERPRTSSRKGDLAPGLNPT